MNSKDMPLDMAKEQLIKDLMPKIPLGAILNSVKFNKYVDLCELVLKLFTKYDETEIEFEKPEYPNYQATISITSPEIEIKDDDLDMYKQILALSDRIYISVYSSELFVYNITTYDFWINTQK